jgi:plastocyanin
MRSLAAAVIAMSLSGCSGDPDVESIEEEPELGLLDDEEPEPLRTSPIAEGPAVAPSYREIDVLAPGVIEGVVRWDGPRAADPVEVTAQVRACGRSQPSPVLRVGRGGELADAVVWIDGIEEGRAIPAAASSFVPVVDQTRCRYTPHVLAVLRGTDVDFRNSDGVLHNVHAFWTDGGGDGQGDEWFNVGQPIAGMVTRKAVERSGVARIVCDAGHTWMSSWLHAFEHPYFAVTDARGAFRIEGVPPGRHPVKVWHESPVIVATRDGRPVYAPPIVLALEVTVPASGTARMEPVLAPAPAAAR